MRPPRRFRPRADSPRLAVVRVGSRSELWTEAAGRPPAVYGERWAEAGGTSYRSFDPFRSKLAAGIVREWSGALPRAGESWLYLGAASGTTASHVADLLGPEGRLYAVERSLRPFARLRTFAERWSNVRPILADVREVGRYDALVPPVDGVYVDVAQPDQVEIARANAATYLRGTGGRLLLALKTSSLGRDASAHEHLVRSESELSRSFDLSDSVRLEPYHRGHYLVGGRARPALFQDARAAPATPRAAHPRGPRRP